MCKLSVAHQDLDQGRCIDGEVERIACRADPRHTSLCVGDSCHIYRWSDVTVKLHERDANTRPSDALPIFVHDAAQSPHTGIERVCV